jgi:PEP-CTERM motif
MKKTLSLLFAVAILSASAFAATITNGDFEAGNTGFSTDYGFIGAPGPTALFGEGTYTVTSSGETSNTYHQFWTPGVTPQAGVSMALFNGLTSAGDPWRGMATGLIVGNTYSVSGYGTSAFPVAAANLQWYIGGTSLGASVDLGTNIGQWSEFTGTFVATATTQELIIRSTQVQAQGNDFALDSLTIADLGGNDVPEPSTYAMFAAGLAGLAALRRRK